MNRLFFSKHRVVLAILGCLTTGAALRANLEPITYNDRRLTDSELGGEDSESSHGESVSTNVAPLTSEQSRPPSEAKEKIPLNKKYEKISKYRPTSILPKEILIEAVVEARLEADQNHRFALFDRNDRCFARNALMKQLVQKKIAEKVKLYNEEIRKRSKELTDQRTKILQSLKLRDEQMAKNIGLETVADLRFQQVQSQKYQAIAPSGELESLSVVDIEKKLKALPGAIENYAATIFVKMHDPDARWGYHTAGVYYTDVGPIVFDPDPFFDSDILNGKMLLSLRSWIDLDWAQGKEASYTLAPPNYIWPIEFEDSVLWSSFFYPPAEFEWKFLDGLTPEDSLYKNNRAPSLTDANVKAYDECKTDTVSSSKERYKKFKGKKGKKEIRHEVTKLISEISQSSN